MLHDVDAALEALLRNEVPLPASDVDLSFDAPDRQWSAALARPTVNVFLYDVARSPQLAASGRQVVHSADAWSRAYPGDGVRLRYLVTGWTAEARDEHQLLAAVMVCLLRQRELPEQYALGSLAGQRPLPAISVGSADDAHRADLWRSLDGELKPALDVSVTAPVDTGIAVPVPRPPTAVDVRHAGR